ncbi:hypothetical protein C8Q70DRAFT_939645 [Cubamyces menziesii]|nr:hypothetical protein C8Q70DRAFT_939645 [Cubamyces menziesii]
MLLLDCLLATLSACRRSVGLYLVQSQERPRLVYGLPEITLARCRTPGPPIAHNRPHRRLEPFQPAMQDREQQLSLKRHDPNPGQSEKTRAQLRMPLQRTTLRKIFPRRPRLPTLAAQSTGNTYEAPHRRRTEARTRVAHCNRADEVLIPMSLRAEMRGSPRNPARSDIG